MIDGDMRRVEGLDLVAVVGSTQGVSVFPDGPEKNTSVLLDLPLAPEIDELIALPRAEDTLPATDTPALTAEDTIKKLLRSSPNQKDRKLRQTRSGRSTYGELPAEYKPELWGVADMRSLRLGDLILLDQVRQSKNPEYDRIRESIKNEGLHKQPDVDLLDEDHFKELLKVIYFRVFKGELPEELVRQFDPDNDGMYPVVTNGNTRTLILIDEAKRRSAEAKDKGYTVNPYDSEVICQVHINRSPEVIIGSQISDNFQSSPPGEDIARTTVSHYQYLRSTGKVHTRADYVSLVGGKFTSDILGGMIAYDKLPEPVHELVNNKALTLGAAIELAKLRDAKMLELGIKLYGPNYQMFVNSFDEDNTNGTDALLSVIDTGEAAEMRHTINLWLTQIASDLYYHKLRDRRFGPVRQKAVLASMKASIEATIAQILGSQAAMLPSEDASSVPDDGVLTAEERKISVSNHKVLREAIQRELTSLANEIANNPLDKIDKVASTLRALGQNSTKSAFEHVQAKKAIDTVLGALGVKGSELNALQEFMASRAGSPGAVAEDEDSLF